ncbi:MAG TPA: bacillithiol system redox-active protein YtxJ [Chitinophagaceae bacterium]|nr:bacillithiol system redox-active protein YtxJ [Chitinophagaceae bacterium]
MHWIHLTETDQLSQIVAKSQNKPQVIFKHSSRCSISSVAFSRMQSIKCSCESDFYFLDILSYRSISDKVAEVFKVEHQSPQVLVIMNGECIFTESHLGISAHEIVEQITLSKAC